VTDFDVIDPDTGQRIRIVLEWRNGRPNLRELKPSISGPGQLSPREAEVRAAFAEGASRSYGRRSTGGQPAAWEPIRRSMAQTMERLTDPRRDRVREERAERQRALRAQLPPELREELERQAAELARARPPQRRRRRSSGGLRPASEGSPDRPESDSDPLPPYWL
jgi:hypothetical protein